MQTKKFTILIVTLALLAACSRENAVTLQFANDYAIQFSAYSASSVVTRGTIVGTSDIFGADKGIGVFAFYQPKATGKFNTYKYATPDFMYNQKVYTENSGTSWTYTPTKYWPNNEGNMLSFFAYAPYDEDKAWEDMGFKTDVNAKKLTTSFAINQEVVDQVDYLYATPVINRTKQAVDANGNSYTTGTNNIKFDFKHITSQVNLYVGVETDKATQTAGAWTSANTTIEVQSIEFKNLSSAINYSYDISSGSIGDLTTIQSKTKQNIILTEENFIETAATINSTNYTQALLDAENAGGFKHLNHTNSVLFLAPETLGKVVITYEVTTTDATNSTNSSTITNIIESDMSNVTLEAGKSYKLNFLIGMNSVKIVAKLTDWATPVIEKQEDVPVNFGDYLCFEAIEAGSTVRMVNKNSAPDVSLVYSKDYYTWNDFIVGTTTVTLTNVGDKVYVKAKNPNNQFASNSDDKNSKCNTFSLSGKVKVSGNIMYLLNGTTPPDNLIPGTNDYCFLRLFANNYAQLSDVSELLLPARTLAKECYTSMFLNNTSITTAPELPATTLISSCYKNMFQKCTALTTAPELPATTLQSQCYYNMFYGCTALTTAPELPATTLAPSCYYSMFYQCNSLTTAPKLPATTLISSCYKNMFQNCTALTTAPELLATTLVESCYNNMFNGCSKLSSVTMLATDVSATNCLGAWLKNAGIDVLGSKIVHNNDSASGEAKSTIANKSGGWTLEYPKQ